MIYYFFPKLPSTNTWAKDQIKAGKLTTPTMIVATTQTAGRGRHDRVWVSNKGGLYATLTTPHHPHVDTDALPRLLGKALAKKLTRYMGKRVYLEWPNDLICKDLKIGGILIESVTNPSGHRFLVIGIGLNINQTQFPQPLMHVAGSIRQIVGKKMVVSQFLPLLHSAVSTTLKKAAAQPVMA